VLLLKVRYEEKWKGDAITGAGGNPVDRHGHPLLASGADLFDSHCDTCTREKGPGKGDAEYLKQKNPGSSTAGASR
jgi:hypothetical protein